MIHLNNQRGSSNTNKPDLTQIVTTDQDSTILFHRTSSSYDESRELRNSLNISSQSANLHVIADTCKSRVSVKAGQVSVLLDHRDILGALAEHLTATEAQIKNLLNVIDTVNVVNMANVENSELLFIAKKSRIGDPIELKAEVADIVIQALYDGKPALKLRLD